MKATLTVEMDSEAFEDHPASELARILRRLARSIEQDAVGMDHPHLIYDLNGNTVGKFEVLP